jgi:hypothetical protein
MLRASPTSNGEATPVVEAPLPVPPSKTAPQPTQATSTAQAAGVPGLALEAANHIGLVSATHTPYLGFDAYQLTLPNGGTGWAINGTPDAVVPKVITDPSYSQAASVLFLSGNYVLYFPNLARMPEAFIVHTGPRPGMSVIDTDRYR